MKYRKKPVIIEAEQYKQGMLGELAMLCHLNEDGTLSIKTLEGTMIVSPNDWIIKGVKGELYPCKPDIFEATYEKVEN